jgi:twitching motility protein PilI
VDPFRAHRQFGKDKMEKAQQQSIDLVEFQQRLNKSLASLQTLGAQSSLLGFVCGGRNWLVKLSDLHEIESVPLAEKTQRLALARGWVMGISNFKGSIYTLVDFQQFLGQQATQTGLNARALLIHPKHHIQAALIVGEVVGLMAVVEMKETDREPGWPWVERQYEYTDGTMWSMLDIGALAVAESMLNIAA